MAAKTSLYVQSNHFQSLTLMLQCQQVPTITFLNGSVVCSLQRSLGVMLADYSIKNLTELCTSIYRYIEYTFEF